MTTDSSDRGGGAQEQMETDDSAGVKRRKLDGLIKEKGRQDA